MFKINVVSNDGQFNISSISNNIRIVSPNIVDNSIYDYNFQLTFNGTFIQSQKAIYISTIYNYYLLNYNVELIGPIDCISGSVMFAAGIDQSNATSLELLTVGSFNDSDVILPGYPLIYFLLDTYTFNLTLKSISSNTLSNNVSVHYFRN